MIEMCEKLIQKFTPAIEFQKGENVIEISERVWKLEKCGKDTNIME